MSVATVQRDVECPICFLDHTYLILFPRSFASLAYRARRKKEFWRHPQVTLLVKCVFVILKYNMSDFWSLVTSGACSDNISFD
jgi:hypothetical protein